VVCPGEVLEVTDARCRTWARDAYLGKGGFAVVWALRDVVTGERVAAKARAAPRGAGRAGGTAARRGSRGRHRARPGPHGCRLRGAQVVSKASLTTAGARHKLETEVALHAPLSHPCVARARLAALVRRRPRP
jgi:hypothetical protein